MLRSYLQMDGGEGHPPYVIEFFRWSLAQFGPHEVRVRRDVLLFGERGHRLRSIIWTKDRPRNEDIALIYAPLVIATDDELGPGRLAELSVWHVEQEERLQVDLVECRDLMEEVGSRLERAVKLLQEAGLLST